MTRARSDRLAATLGVLFLMIAIVVGLRAHERDVDEVVFQNTLTAMHHGEGYYPAMRNALIKKEGRPPSEIRSIRPPTLFLALYRFPAAAVRWLVGVVFLASLVLAWRLGSPLADYGGPVVVAVVGFWLVAASPMLYLHSELWGLPLLLGGVLAMRAERWAAAALCLGAAVLFRETYAVAFVAGLLWSKDRRYWWPALACLAGLGGAHAVLASRVISAHGLETPFGASGLSLRYALTAVGPGTQPLAWGVGVVAGLLGLTGLARRWASDRGARMLLTFAAVMYPATILVGRTYWGLAFGAAVACFAPAGGVVLWRAVTSRFPHRQRWPRRRPFRAASS